MKIIFIYNANSGKVNTLLDIGHKILSPATYSCNLCSITHGIFSEREAWKQYRLQSNHELEFLHKDEFENKYNYKQELTYPVILTENENGNLDVLVSTEEINRAQTIDELIQLLPT